MSFTYDFVNAPAVSYVRLLISDTDATQPIFQDNEINAAYTVQASVWQSTQFYSPPAGAYIPTSPVSYFRVAAILLDAIASNKARLASIKRILDVQLDASDAAKWLMEQAKNYREIDDNSAAFLVVEQVHNDWSLISRYWKQVQRQQGIPF